MVEVEGQDTEGQKIKAALVSLRPSTLPSVSNLLLKYNVNVLIVSFPFGSHTHTVRSCICSVMVLYYYYYFFVMLPLDIVILIKGLKAQKINT